MSIKNIPGAAGTIGLTEFVKSRDKNSLMMVGETVVGGVIVNETDANLSSVTPIARLSTVSGVLAVPADSPYKTLADFLAAFKKNPGQVPLGGGSLGGVDHLFIAELAKKVGVPLKDINYSPFAGGGETISALASGELVAGINPISAYGESLEAGKLRALAVTSKERVPTFQDVPTFIEQGIDVQSDIWFGVVAPKSISAQERNEIIEFVDTVHGSEGWRKESITYGWKDSYITGEEFEKFLRAEEVSTRKIIDELNIPKPKG
ncbi:MAG: Bug family tripartite tricarboxylate transporter substrate binding protein [Actinomycetota bacterium]